MREAQRTWTGTIHGSRADYAVAALGADPATLEELEVATELFVRREGEGRFLRNQSLGSCDEPYDAGLMVIDLAARLVVVDSTYSSPDSVGCVSYDDGQDRTDVRLTYHLADDWLITGDGEQWQAVARSRRAHPPARNRRWTPGRSSTDGRCWNTSREIFAAFTPREAVAHDVRPQWMEEAIREIHAAWLLTPPRIWGRIAAGSGVDTA